MEILDLLIQVCESNIELLCAHENSLKNTLSFYDKQIKFYEEIKKEVLNVNGKC